MDPKENKRELPCWMPDARGWIGISIFIITVMLLWMMKEDRGLREDEFFQTIATIIISNGFVGGLIAWAYASTKGGGELAEKNAAIVAESATATVATGVANRETPTQVEVVNTQADPVPTTNGPAPTVPEELPDYAKP